MEQDTGAALWRIVQFDRTDLVGTLAVGRPAPGFLTPRLAADYTDPVRHHEGRIEADAELADELLIVSRSAGLHAFHEGTGAGSGDGAEGLGHLIAAHADAVVFHDKLPAVWIGG